MPKAAQSLFERTRGPNPLPIAELMARAEIAADGVKKDYLAFLRSRMPVLDDFARGAPAGAREPWRSLAMAAHDIRSSAASAGYDQLSATAASLEWLLSEAPAGHPKVADIIRLHLDALKYLLAAEAPPLGSGEVQALLTSLAKASNHVTRARH